MKLVIAIKAASGAAVSIEATVDTTGDIETQFDEVWVKDNCLSDDCLWDDWTEEEFWVNCDEFDEWW